MWIFWPAVVTAFLASFSVGHKQVRIGCNDDENVKRRGLTCRATGTDGTRLNLAEFTTKTESTLDATSIKGAAIEEFEWKEPREEAHPFTVGIVEYDDEGKAWNRSQIQHVKDLVTDTLKEDDALVVTFVHGWKNNCTTCNGNLACFREVLALLSAVEHNIAIFSADKRPRRVIGVYVGWRGKTMRIPYADSISAFSRKSAADRVGGRTSELTGFLSWLNETRVNANRKVEDPEQRRPRHKSPFDTRLVLVGHSFGADVLFGAIAGHLSAQLGASAADRAGLRAQPFGNLTVLVNPALEASAYSEFNDNARTGVFGVPELPLIVTVQAENDPVTHYVFPVERALVSLGSSTKSTQGYGAALSAVGHYPDYYTHTLREPKSANAAAERTAAAATERPASAMSCGCERLTATRKAHADLARSVNEALQQTPPTDRVHIGAPMKGLRSTLDLWPDGPGTRKTNPDSPLMLVRATPEVVNQHSGIYQPQFFDFLANLVVREQLLEDQKGDLRTLMSQTMERAATDLK